MSLRPEVRLFVGHNGRYDPARDVIEPGLYLTSLVVAVGYHW
jgi:hypothetical protein